MASIGLRGLDEVKGFPQPGLTVCFGGPGCGKTILALSLMQECVTSNEKGVFVSFVEGRDKLLEYAGLLGYDLKGLESRGIVKIVEMPTLTPDSMESVLKSILDEVSHLGAKRLVLDSFSAVSHMIKDTDTIRGFLHNIFTKVLRGMGVTTFVTLEQYTRDHVPTVEEYVADAVLELKQNLSEDGVFTRELTIHKFRGAYLAQKRYAYTLHNGFTVFPPIKKPIAEAVLPEVVEEKEGFSTGMRELDNILGGELHFGSHLLTTIGHSAPLSSLVVISPLIFQSVSKSRGVLILPPRGYSPHLVKQYLLKGITEEQLHNRVRVIDFGKDFKEKWVVNLEGNVERDFEKIHSAHQTLKDETKKPILRVMGPNTVEAIYGEQCILHLTRDIAWVRNQGDVRVDVGWSGTSTMGSMIPLTDFHLDFFELDGALFMRGLKPKTEVFNMKEVAVDGRRHVIFTPVV